MSSVFDQTHFAHMTAGDAALQAEVVGLFRMQVADWMRQTELESGDTYEQWRAAIHTMKGSARGVGLWRLAEACARAEEQPEAGRAAAAVQVRAAMAEALTALDAVFA